MGSVQSAPKRETVGAKSHDDVSGDPGTIKLPSGQSRFLIRLVTCCAALIAVWHIGASFLWIAPVTPLRELIPGNILTSYMIPFFGQSWSVFAPDPINGDYHFNVRAVISENGNERVTEWVSASDAESAMATHNLFPPRAARLAIKQSSNLMSAWWKLNEEQKKVAGGDYFAGDSWLGQLQIDMNAKGNQEAKIAVARYIGQERYADAYATQLAHAMWGKNVVRVQYQSIRQDIVPFEQRNDPNAKRPNPQSVVTGWRGLIVLDGQSEEDFANVFVPQYESVNGGKGVQK